MWLRWKHRTKLKWQSKETNCQLNTRQARVRHAFRSNSSSQPDQRWLLWLHYPSLYRHEAKTPWRRHCHLFFLVMSLPSALIFKHCELSRTLKRRGEIDDMRSGMVGVLGVKQAADDVKLSTYTENKQRTCCYLLIFLVQHALNCLQRILCFY